MQNVYKDVRNKLWLKDAKNGKDTLYIGLTDVSHLYKLPKGLVFVENGIGAWSSNKEFKKSLTGLAFRTKSVLIFEDNEYYFNTKEVSLFLKKEYYKCKTYEEALKFFTKYYNVLFHFLELDK